MHIEDQTFPERCGHMLGRKGMRDYLRVLAGAGDTLAARADMILFDEFNRLVGLDEHAELDARYATPD